MKQYTLQNAQAASPAGKMAFGMGAA